MITVTQMDIDGPGPGNDRAIRIQLTLSADDRGVDDIGRYCTLDRELHSREPAAFFQNAIDMYTRYLEYKKDK